MDGAAKRQRGLGGKLDPERRVNSSWVLLGSLHPGLLLSSAALMLVRSMFLKGTGVCHTCKATAEGAWSHLQVLADARGWEPTLDGLGLDWSWELQAFTSKSLPSFWPKYLLAASDSCLVR